MHAGRSQRGSKAFTLIELLVVIAIIGVLIALLLPAVQKVREAANQTTCKNNLKQLGLAMQNYYATHNAFPPGAQTKQPSPAIQHGWATFILPQLEQEPLHSRYKWDLDWKSAVETPPNSGISNLNVVKEALKMTQCPSAPSLRTDPITGAAASDYAPMFGIHNSILPLLPPPKPTVLEGILVPVGFPSPKIRISDINDGASNTLTLVEVAARPEVWTLKGLQSTTGGLNPGWGDPASGMLLHSANTNSNPPTSPGSCAVNCANYLSPDAEVFALHPGGAICAFADGSVRFINASVPLPTFAAMATRRGNDLVSGDY